MLGSGFGGLAEAFGEGGELLLGDRVEPFVGALYLLAEAGQGLLHDRLDVFHRQAAAVGQGFLEGLAD